MFYHQLHDSAAGELLHVRVTAAHSVAGCQIWGFDLKHKEDSSCSNMLFLHLAGNVPNISTGVCCFSLWIKKTFTYLFSSVSPISLNITASKSKVTPHL